MIGQACAMLGAASWQILASVLKMPVSGTHSIVGAVLGFALVANQGIEWMAVLRIGEFGKKLSQDEHAFLSGIVVRFANSGWYHGRYNVQNHYLVHSVSRRQTR